MVSDNAIIMAIQFALQKPLELAHDCKPMDTDPADNLHPTAFVTRDTCAKQVVRGHRLLWWTIW